MFTIVQVLPAETLPLFRRWFAKPPQPSVEKVAVRGGAFFYKVSVHAAKSGLTDFSFLPAAVGIAAQRILFCGEMCPQLPPPLQLYTPRIFPNLLFMNTVCAFLSENRTQFPNCSVGIYDADAHLQSAMLGLVPFVKSIRIFCEDPLQYESLQAEILESAGLSVVVCDTKSVLNGCDIVLYPFETTADGKIGTLTVFHGGKTVLTGEGLLLPQEYAARCPAGTDTLLYASALYECCNALDLRVLRYTKFAPIT